MRIFIYLLCFSCLLSSCRFFGGERVNGSGNVITEQRTASSFENVSVSGGMNVHVTQGSSFAVSIRTDDNLMAYIEVRVEGNTLVVEEKDGFNLKPTKDLILYITAPVFREIEVSGSGNITSGNTIRGNGSLEIDVSGSANIDMDLDIYEINTTISGSGTVALSGRANKMAISLSGSGSIKCFALNSDEVSIHISGSANAEVTANQKLDVSVSGSSDVYYKGNAAVTQSISGSGSVKKMG